MSAPKFRPSVKGFNEAMRSQRVRDTLLNEATAMATEAGDGFEATEGRGEHPWVARAFVQTTTPQAYARNRRDQILLRVLQRRTKAGPS